MRDRGKEEKLLKWREGNQLFKGTSVTFSNFAVTITVDPAAVTLQQLKLGLKVTYLWSSKSLTILSFKRVVLYGTIQNKPFTVFLTS